MDKVILLTNCPEECNPLISCIKSLFPECKIQVQPKQADGLEHASSALEPSTAYRMYINFAKSLRKRMAENSC